MKNVFTKITSLTLAILVLLSTLSIAIDKHFCGDYLVDIAYFGKAKSCSPIFISNKSCETKIVKKKPCCSDEIEHIQGQDELKIDLYKASIIKKHFIVAFITSRYFLFETPLQHLVVLLKNYNPPEVLYKNIQVLFEVFLI